MATLDDFKKLDFRVAEILEVNPHPDADRLYVVKVRIGEAEKQLVAGIREHYSPEDLKGKKVVIIDNLDPVVLRGVESQGMLLVAKDATGLCILTLDKTLASGARIS